MKELRIASVVVLFITIICFILWKFVIPMPDWFIRIGVVLMLVANFTAVFSTIKITLRKNQSN